MVYFLVGLDECLTSYFTTTDCRNRCELCFNKAFKELAKHYNLWFDQNIELKLRAWYITFLPSERSGAGAPLSAAVQGKL